MVQNIVAALLVGGCFGYALWAFGPKALRNHLAAKLLMLPCPPWMQKHLHAALRQQGGCGSCGGCDGKEAPSSHHGTAEAIQYRDKASFATHVRPLEFRPYAGRKRALPGK